MVLECILGCGLHHWLRDVCSAASPGTNLAAAAAMLYMCVPHSAQTGLLLAFMPVDVLVKALYIMHPAQLRI
jgi:hypothetical protein